MRDLVKAFKALSDETRLRMLNILMERECCVCEVMQALQISQARASRNLGALYDAGFLKLRRDGLCCCDSSVWRPDTCGVFIDSLRFGTNLRKIDYRDHSILEHNSDGHQKVRSPLHRLSCLE